MTEVFTRDVNPLPAAEVIGPSTVPDTYAPDLAGGNIESTQITPSRSALDFWESRVAENATPSGRIEVVPADGSNPHVDVGDVFGGPTVGPVDYSEFAGYTIAATTLGSVEHNNLAPTLATAETKNQLAVAT